VGALQAPIIKTLTECPEKKETGNTWYKIKIKAISGRRKLS
jgi:hypothetical protein